MNELEKMLLNQDDVNSLLDAIHNPDAKATDYAEALTKMGKQESYLRNRVYPFIGEEP